MRVTHHRALYVALLVLLTGTAACARLQGTRRAATDPARAATSRSPARDCPAKMLRAVVASCNIARRRAHLRALVGDVRLARAARRRAATMAAENRLSHAGWERTVRAEFDTAGIIGENIAYNYPTAAAVTRNWLASPAHRANILQASFRRIGVGCAVDGNGQHWWTQEFAD